MRISRLFLAAVAALLSAPAAAPAQAETPVQAEVRNLGANILAAVAQPDPVGEAGTGHIRRMLLLRSQALATLIRENPSEALRLAFPPDVLGVIGRAVPGAGSLLEQRGTWQGQVEYLIFDAPGSRQSTERISIRNGTEVASVHFTGTVPSRLKSGDTLTVSGVRVGEEIAAAGSDATAVAAAAPTCNPVGTQNTAVLLVTFPGIAPGVTPEAVQEMFFGTTGQSLSGFWSEVSYRKTSAAGRVLGWYTLDRVYSCSEYQLLRDAAVRAADPDIDFTQVQRLFIVFPNGSSCSWAGLSTVGCGTVSSADGNVTASTSWLLSNYIADRTEGVQLITHEAGHGLGLNHAASRDFGAEALGPLGASGTLSEYGDGLSTMGDWNLGHYSAQHKAQLGWLAEGIDYQTVQAGTTTAIQPLEADGGIRALRVQRGTGNDAWLWLEYRQPIGAYDPTLPGPIFSGALIHYEDSTTGAKTHLIDFTPETYSFLDPALAAGSNWTDPYTNVSLGVTSGSALGVSVAYGSVPCVRSAPALTITPTNGSGSAGSTIAYTVSVTSRDTTGCGDASFSLSAAVPSGWSGSVSPAALVLPPGVSATAEMQVVSATGVGTGTYDVAANVSSAEGATSVPAAYTVTPPPEPVAVSLAVGAGPYTVRSTVPLSARVTSGTAGAGGAAVTFTVVRPNGTLAAQRAVTADAAGAASWSYKIGPREQPGTYTVRVDATYLGGSATASGAFNVK